MHGQLAREFAEAAVALRYQTEPKEIFETVLGLASSTVLCDHASLLLFLGAHQLESIQATDSTADKADHLQVELRQGPCWLCLSDPGPEAVLVGDTTTDRRWRAWTPLIADLGVRSLMSTRLDTYDETVGFLTWYDDSPDKFSAEAIACAHVLALQAAAVLARAGRST
jgi:GAF domain-containing protein